MRLHDIKPNPGAKHRRKRLGCGESSGLGKTCGKGNKGQKARAGCGIRESFEGGQMPLYRRLPKKGFNNARFKTVYEVFNLKDLVAKFGDGDEVNAETLRACGLSNRKADGIKILGDGDLSIKLKVRVDRVSGSARAKIEAAGGSVEEVSLSSGSEEA
jgi:large subunit ribosomal protein L15